MTNSDILKKFMKEYKHLQKFYKTKKEFKQDLLSGEVKISIPDMISFIDKQNSDKKYSEKEVLNFILNKPVNLDYDEIIQWFSRNKKK